MTLPEKLSVLLRQRKIYGISFNENKREVEFLVKDKLDFLDMVNLSVLLGTVEIVVTTSGCGFNDLSIECQNVYYWELEQANTAPPEGGNFSAAG